MDLFTSAADFAAKKHLGQKRKISGIPYLLHPMEAAAIAASMTNDEEVLCAAMLHDTVEDTDTTPEQLQALFGERVAYLVSTETENKRRDLPAAETWIFRKQETLETLKNAEDIGVKILWLSDKLSNMRSFYREYVKVGSAVWNACHEKDPTRQAWYYRSVAECLSCLSGYEAYKEYVKLINKVFENE